MDHVTSGGTTTLMCTISDRDHLPSPFWNMSWYDMANRRLGCHTVTQSTYGTPSTTCNLNLNGTRNDYKCMIKRHPLDTHIIVSAATSSQYEGVSYDSNMTSSVIAGTCFGAACFLLVVLFVIYKKAGEYYDQRD